MTQEKARAQRKASNAHRSCESLKFESLVYLDALKQARLCLCIHAILILQGRIVKRTTNEGFVGFYKCLSKLKLLKALKEGFDPRQVSFFKDVELKANLKEVVVDSVSEDEFATLVDSTPSLPSWEIAESSATPRQEPSP
ncbi:hypothetical protein Salat_2508500 [Sesamum alatum]|uniref:Uncharacterized protein n=1 Tax=Sesamum alatum TaxID=300844 RepID=A0AAE1XRU3_9LAMI|nr:hypothetical protein Salat_2508500 [Sesamum alatum]